MVQLLHHPEELEGEISSSPLPLSCSAEALLRAKGDIGIGLTQKFVLVGVIPA